MVVVVRRSVKAELLPMMMCRPTVEVVSQTTAVDVDVVVAAAGGCCGCCSAVVAEAVCRQNQ